MAQSNFGWLKEVGGIFKFGTGILAKSAIVLTVLLIAIIIAASRLHSDSYIVAVVGVGVIAFFIWLFSVLKFAGNHPDIALLEGAEWSGYQRFQAAAKGYSPPATEQQPAIAPGTQIITINPEIPEQETEDV
jgi:hypothetical protein